MRTSRSIIAKTAPQATTRDIFLGADGKPDNAKSRDSALSIGVPGTVAGLSLALEKYGSGNFTLAQLVKPAIDLARDGFALADDMADTLPDGPEAAVTLAGVDEDLLPSRRDVAARWRPTGAEAISRPR